MGKGLHRERKRSMAAFRAKIKIAMRSEPRLKQGLDKVFTVSQSKAWERVCSVSESEAWQCSEPRLK